MSTATATRQKPILMNGPMAKAAHEGRKTQTRRLADKLRGFGKITELQKSTTPGYDWQFRCKRGLWQDFRHAEFIKLAPYQPGDLLYVRETFRANTDGDFVVSVNYRADDTMRDFYIDQLPKEVFKTNMDWVWVRSIHMPKWAARTWLEVTGVRCERVAEIEAADCLAEGIELPAPTGCDADGHEKPDNWATMSEAHREDWIGGTARAIYFARCADAQNHIDAFRELWNATYPGSWEANPWVWVYEFKPAVAP